VEDPRKSISRLRPLHRACSVEPATAYCSVTRRMVGGGSRQRGTSAARGRSDLNVGLGLTSLLWTHPTRCWELGRGHCVDFMAGARARGVSLSCGRAVLTRAGVEAARGRKGPRLSLWRLHAEASVGWTLRAFTFRRRAVICALSFPFH
jgi:hypothetical protein